MKSKMDINFYRVTGIFNDKNIIFYEYLKLSIELIDFLRLPRPHGERRKSIYSPWGWGK